MLDDSLLYLFSFGRSNKRRIIVRDQEISAVEGFKVADRRGPERLLPQALNHRLTKIGPPVNARKRIEDVVTSEAFRNSCLHAIDVMGLSDKVFATTLPIRCEACEARRKVFHDEFEEFLADSPLSSHAVSPHGNGRGSSPLLLRQDNETFILGRDTRENMSATLDHSVTSSSSRVVAIGLRTGSPRPHRSGRNCSNGCSSHSVRNARANDGSHTSLLVSTETTKSDVVVISFSTRIISTHRD